MNLTLILFCCVYLALAIGHLPGFRLDRTGAVMVGALLLIVSEQISFAAAWAAVDYQTIGLLFGLMVVSSAFSVAGFYDWVTAKVGGLRVSPAALLAVLIAVAAVLSALLTNDVVAVAMTPILVSICFARGLNPMPFMLGFCFALNVGSAATLIGSPQNMIAGEALKISFVRFAQASALPAALGLVLVWGGLAWLYRGKWLLVRAETGPAGKPASVPSMPFNLDVPAVIKAALVTAVVIAAFIATGWPHALVALGGASFLLISRHVASKELLAKVNGNLLLLLMGLFVVNAAMASTGIPQTLLEQMRGFGLDLHDAPSLLIVMAVLSNVVGNNPAVMLIAPFLHGVASPDATAAAIALGTGFSSNAFIFTSLAGIIVAEEGRLRGVNLSFSEFSKAGIPVALLSLVLAYFWVRYAL
jgi:Na+/H+ antiporter NhaD/arsenite permease-like protein